MRRLRDHGGEQTGILEEIGNFIQAAFSQKWNPYTGLPADQTQPTGLFGPGSVTNPVPSDTEQGIRKDFLMWEAVVLGGMIAAPVIYRAYAGSKKGKRARMNEDMAIALDNASARSVALLASIGPAIGFPMAYMSVQCLEDRGVITKGLGNTVQSLMAVAAAGQAASAVGGLLQTAITKGVK